MSKRPSLAESMRKLEAQPASALTATNTIPPKTEQEAPKGRGYFAASRAGLKKVTVGLQPEAHKQLKLLVIERGNGTTAEDLLREAVSDLFRKYDKPPVA